MPRRLSNDASLLAFFNNEPPQRRTLQPATRASSSSSSSLHGPSSDIVVAAERRQRQRRGDALASASTPTKNKTRRRAGRETEATNAAAAAALTALPHVTTPPSQLLSPASLPAPHNPLELDGTVDATLGQWEPKAILTEKEHVVVQLQRSPPTVADEDAEKKPAALETDATKEPTPPEPSLTAVDPAMEAVPKRKLGPLKKARGISAKKAPAQQRSSQRRRAVPTKQQKDAILVDRWRARHARRQLEESTSSSPDENQSGRKGNPPRGRRRRASPELALKEAPPDAMVIMVHDDDSVSALVAASANDKSSPVHGVNKTASEQTAVKAVTQSSVNDPTVSADKAASLSGRANTNAAEKPIDDVSRSADGKATALVSSHQPSTMVDKDAGGNGLVVLSTNRMEKRTMQQGAHQSTRCGSVANEKAASVEPSLQKASETACAKVPNSETKEAVAELGSNNSPTTGDSIGAVNPIEVRGTSRASVASLSEGVHSGESVASVNGGMNHEAKSIEKAERPRQPLKKKRPTKRPSTDDDGSSSSGSKRSKARPLLSDWKMPSYVDEKDPASVTDAYNEYKGLGRFLDQPVPGGFANYLPWNIHSAFCGTSPTYPRFRVVKTAANLIEKKARDEKRAVDDVLREMDDHSRADNAGIWDYLYKFTDREGPKQGLKKPSPIANKRVCVRPPPLGHPQASGEMDGKKRTRSVADQGSTETASAGPKRARVRCSAGNTTSQEAADPASSATREHIATGGSGAEQMLPASDDYVGNFCEETAFLFARSTESRSLGEATMPPPPAAPFPPPDGLAGDWKYDSESRVYSADFSTVDPVPLATKQFVSQLMDRDDITLLTKGLLRSDDSEDGAIPWSLETVECELGGCLLHKFRQFQRIARQDGSLLYVELDGYLSMTVSDYMRYLKRRKEVLAAGTDRSMDRSFVYCDHSSKKRKVIDDVVDLVIYMTDVELGLYGPTLGLDFRDHFKLPEALPGGKWCMMHSIPQSAQPAMGPNLYLTPGGGFTQLHQDGHGTVDSGHYNMAGYNEVVMLRRMPEEQKQEASKLMPQNGDKYDALYALPHDDSEVQGERPSWPTNNTIAAWKLRNFCPSVFILEPGWHVHINKGRLHAFRKLTVEPLPENDCHATLRRDLIKRENLSHAPECLSVAWDWMRLGSDADGTNREVASIIEGAALCHNKAKGRQVLATPEAGLLWMAARLGVVTQQSTDGPATVPQSKVELCRGILPSLKHVALRQQESCKKVLAHARSSGVYEVIEDGEIADMEKNPDPPRDKSGKPLAPLSTVDARGNDYYCKLCLRELSNAYLHCNGCEKLFEKDFNICADCFVANGHATVHEMSKLELKFLKRSDRHHTGNMTLDRSGSACPCKKGRCCDVCKKCTACSCKCHHSFTLHMRHMTLKTLDERVKRIEEIVGENPVRYGKETETRLRLVDGDRMTAVREKNALVAVYMKRGAGNESAACSEVIAL